MKGLTVRSFCTGRKIPELKRVIIAYENEIVMEETLEKALEKLFRTDQVDRLKAVG